MKILWMIVLSLFFPLLAHADSSLSLTPPSTDYSVIFLGNLFGVVDGVLHGTGSQIMGKMFGVFNAAVLALGGIVVTYTLIVGTMNTSHEGQFLGQKWSSIWIPVRSTIGLALLIPKSSGYCLMQIFIMWVVVQGVGAADKIWNAALDYLNMGGVIVGAQSNTNSTTSSNSAVETIVKGESRILIGQVCMKALQTSLENVRADYLDSKESGGGPCLDSNTSTDADMKYFCNTSVPDFLSTVNVVEASNNNLYAVNMPNFQGNTLYASLNGLCGQIKWNKLDISSDTQNLDYVSADDVATMNQSRAIGIQQMYMDLSPVAISMVDNDPQLKINNSWDSTKRYSSIAQDQYGIPLLSTTQQPCSDGPSEDCMNWGPASSTMTQTFILSGLELMNTMADYNAIMMPVINLMSQSNNAAQNNTYHSFISTAESSGWIMAGTYFFDLANLNGSVQTNMNEVDSDSGLDQVSDFATSSTNLTTPFSSGSGQYSILLKLFNNNDTYVKSIINLVTAESVDKDITPNVSSSSDHKAVTSLGSSSVYGYVNNSSMIHLPGQPGLVEPTFKFNLNMQPGTTILKIPKMDFGCGFKILFFCVGGPLANLVWNTLIHNVLDIFISFITNLFDMVVQQLLIAPLTTMMTILNAGVQSLNTSQSHPIVALAYMGTSFINYVTQLYFQLLAISEIFSMGGAIILVIILPFLAAWMSIMFSVGFIDAYYVPFLPYMIFTFGSIAWLMAVVESMVAGPIVALGITHPEGHDALGKAEQAIMILVNVFLRPAMMIIGYIAGIALCYVGVFIINSGFSHVMEFLMPSGGGGMNFSGYTDTRTPSQAGTPYVNYASMYAGFFCLLAYTTIYLTVVEKSFTLIYLLPDNVLRWIGGQPESIGKETAQWADATKEKIKEAGAETGKAAQKTSEDFGQGAGKKKDGKGKGSVKAT